MQVDVVDSVAWLTVFIPPGLAFHVALHFFVVPTASKLWDWFAAV